MEGDPGGLPSVGFGDYVATDASRDGKTPV